MIRSTLRNIISLVFLLNEFTKDMETMIIYELIIVIVVNSSTGLGQFSY